MGLTIAVFGASRSVEGDVHYEEAIRCGHLLAQAGFAVATGGYSGAMEAVSRGARQAGGHVVGVTAPSVFPDRAGANRHLTTETRAGSLIERIGLLADGTAGSIALWGSLGTAAELIVAWNLAYVAPFSDTHPKPIIAVGEPWMSLIPHLEMALATTPDLVTVVRDVDIAVVEISRRLRIE
ncbi:MAG: LOG family protein [Acidimicrobiia bacterium]